MEDAAVHFLFKFKKKVRRTQDLFWNKAIFKEAAKSYTEVRIAVIIIISSVDTQIMGHFPLHWSISPVYMQL